MPGPRRTSKALVLRRVTLSVDVSRATTGKIWPVVLVRPVEIEIYVISVHQTATQSVETVHMDGPYTPLTFVLFVLNAAPTLYR